MEIRAQGSHLPVRGFRISCMTWLWLMVAVTPCRTLFQSPVGYQTAEGNEIPRTPENGETRIIPTKDALDLSMTSSATDHRLPWTTLPSPSSAPLLDPSPTWRNGQTAQPDPNDDQVPHDQDSPTGSWAPSAKESERARRSIGGGLPIPVTGLSRWGRGVLDNNFLRFGRAGALNDNFLRFGRGGLRENFLRFGRKDSLLDVANGRDPLSVNWPSAPGTSESGAHFQEAGTSNDIGDHHGRPDRTSNQAVDDGSSPAGNAPESLYNKEMGSLTKIKRAGSLNNNFLRYGRYYYYHPALLGGKRGSLDRNFLRFGKRSAPGPEEPFAPESSSSTVVTSDRLEKDAHGMDRVKREVAQNHRHQNHHHHQKPQRPPQLLLQALPPHRTRRSLMLLTPPWFNEDVQVYPAPTENSAGARNDENGDNLPSYGNIRRRSLDALKENFIRFGRR